MMNRVYSSYALPRALARYRTEISPIRSEHVVRRQKTFPLRPARQPHMAGPRTSGAIPRLARRAEMAHAEPGIAARTIAGTETDTR